MKNKLLLPMFILLFCMTALLAGCGGGTGSSNAPGNVNAGVPTVIKLLPVQYIAQTNSFITLKARVLDGNGNVVQNYLVSFTNMSLTGVLSAVTANTDSHGNAEVSIFSTAPGFATILAQVNTGQGMVRDNKTVYFTSASSLNLFPTMALDVEGNDSNSTYNDPADYNLFETGVADDTQVTIRATVYNSVGLLVSGATVTFGSDFPYKIGSDPAAECSDGTTICGVTFPLGNTATTDSSGQAFVLVQVTPTVLTNMTTVLNITATANNGAFNMTSLFLSPVTIGTISVSANPPTVASAGTSEITAFVKTSAGTPVPDNTIVNFTAPGAGIDPYSPTTGGIATATLTAPTGPTIVSVTASVGGKSGPASVNVTAPVVPPTPPTPPAALTLTASVLAVDGNLGGTVAFTVAGGSSTTYTSTSENALLVFNDNGVGTGGVSANGSRESGESGVWTTASFTATIESCTPAGTVVITANDGTTTVTKTITIQNFAGTTAASRPTILPATATIFENGGGGSNSQVYLVTQGAGLTLATLTGTASNISVIKLTPAGSQAALAAAVVPFTAEALFPSITVNTTVNLLFTNNLGCKAGATVRVINE